MNLCAWQESNLTCAVGRYRNRRIIYTVMKRNYVRKYLDSNSVNVRNMCELYPKEPLTARPIAGCQRGASCDVCKLDCVWNVMAHAQKPDFVLRRNGRVRKSAGTLVQSTTGSRGVRISGSNAGYTTNRGGVKGTGYPFHSPVCPSLPLPCVTVCHHVSTGLYRRPRWVTLWFYLNTVLKIYITVQLRFNVPRYILQRKKRRIRLTFCVMKLPRKTFNYYFSWRCF